jgi:hypothetical protein
VTPADNPGRRAADGSDVPEPGAGPPAAERSLWAKADLLDPAANRRPRPTDHPVGSPDGDDAAAVVDRDAEDGDLRADAADNVPSRPTDSGTAFTSDDSPLWRKANALDGGPSRLDAETGPNPSAHRSLDEKRGIPTVSAVGVDQPHESRYIEQDPQREPTSVEMEHDSAGPVRDVPEDPSSTDNNPAYVAIHEELAMEITEREGQPLGRVVGIVAEYINRIDAGLWREGTREQRIPIMVVAADRVREAMSLQEVELRPADGVALGSYRRHEGKHTISINPNLEISDTLATIVHEMRHALQKEVILGQREHPRADEWDDNDLEYIPFHSDYNAYAAQPVEADAFAYERAVGRHLGLDWPNL